MNLPYALYGLKQGRPNVELITRALPTQIEWNLLDLKESLYKYIPVKFRSKRI